jgi:cytochrome c oxidase subunit 2
VNRIPPALGQPASSTTRNSAPRRTLPAFNGTRRRLRALGVSLTLASLAALAFAPGAFAFFTPQSGGSPNADQIDSLYKITLYIALVIFVAVEGALGYALWKFRARKGAVPAQIRGNTRLEIAWTGAAAVILIVLAVFTFAKLSSIQDPSNSDASGDKLVGESGLLYASADRKLPPDGKSLNIDVNGQQYIWRYTYPGATNKDGLGAPYSYEEMVVPTNTTVTLDITSSDVVHSWWVPQLGGKFQAVPGYHNYSWFKISKPGIYRGQCANLCGRGHARMIATVKAVPPAQFDEWLAYQKKLISEANVAAENARQQLGKQTGAGQVENP